MSNENGDTSAKVPRHRSPNYPGISLKAAVEKITAWFQADGHVASPEGAALKIMGGDPGRVKSAVKAFGLVAEESGRLKLTQRGLDIAARKGDDPKRAQALREAAVGPAIYRDLVKEYPGGKVSETTLQSELIAGKHFNPNYVADFIKDFRATLEFAEISPETVVESGVDTNSTGEEKPMLNVGEFAQWESQGVLQFPAPRRIAGLSEDCQWAFFDGSSTGVPMSELTLADPPAGVPQASIPAAYIAPVEKLKKAPPPNPQFVPPSNIRQDVFSLGEGTVTVQWPALISPESFEDVSAWLDILKRKIGRSVIDEKRANGDA